MKPVVSFFGILNGRNSAPFFPYRLFAGGRSVNETEPVTISLGGSDSQTDRKHGQGVFREQRLLFPLIK